MLFFRVIRQKQSNNTKAETQRPRTSQQWETDWLYPSKHLPAQETTRREGLWPSRALHQELKAQLFSVLLIQYIHIASDGAETGALHHLHLLLSFADVPRTAGREGGTACSLLPIPCLGRLEGQETRENVTNWQRQKQLGSGKHYTEISGKMSMNKGKRQIKIKVSFLSLWYSLLYCFQ